MMTGATNHALRDRHLISGLFPQEMSGRTIRTGRFIIGSAVPVGGALALPVQIEPGSAAGHPLDYADMDPLR